MIHMEYCLEFENGKTIQCSKDYVIDLAEEYRFFTEVYPWKVRLLNTAIRLLKMDGLKTWSRVKIEIA